MLQALVLCIFFFANILFLFIFYFFSVNKKGQNSPSLEQNDSTFKMARIKINEILHHIYYNYKFAVIFNNFKIS